MIYDLTAIFIYMSLGFMLGFVFAWFLGWSTEIALQNEIKKLKKQLTLKAVLTPIVKSAIHDFIFWNGKHGKNNKRK